MANILFLIEHLKGGGAERVVSEISAELESRHNVYVAVFANLGTSYRHCKQIIDIGLPGTENKLKKPVNLFRRSNAVRKLKKDKHIDVCISFMSNANIVNVVSGYSHVICSIRTVLSSVVKGKIRRFFDSWSLRRAETVVTLSNYVRQDLIDSFGIRGEKIITIYNPVYRVPQIVEERDKRLEKTSNLSFVTAGRMVTAKGQWHLIKAFYEYQKRNGGELILLGTGQLEDKLKALVKYLGIGNSVHFKGFVNNPLNEFKKADVFVMTSLWEGFGNAIIEAMSTGLPVISSDCPGGPHEIISPNQSKEGAYGILTSPFPQTEDIVLSQELTNEERSLLQAMERMNNPSERMIYSVLSFKRSEEFRIDKIANQWNTLIETSIKR